MATTAPINNTPVDERSRQLRLAIVVAIKAGNRGHVGSSFSLVEIFRVLYDDILKFDPKDPRWSGRDRCILSKGHGCLALYAVLADKGFFPKSELLSFCKPEGILGGHPEYGKVPGVEASTGSLGHGLSIGVGMALNARVAKSSHRVFVVISDGESNEGSMWEAAMCAAKHKLDNLTVLCDYNKQQSYGTTYEVLDLEPLADKWRAFGFSVREADGHNVEELRTQLKSAPFEPGKPSIILCHTIKGKGISFVENNLKWHHKTKIADEEMDGLMAELGEPDWRSLMQAWGK
jgi:transketolase